MQISRAARISRPPIRAKLQVHAGNALSSPAPALARPSHQGAPGYPSQLQSDKNGHDSALQRRCHGNSRPAGAACATGARRGAGGAPWGRERPFWGSRRWRKLAGACMQLVWLAAYSWGALSWRPCALPSVPNPLRRRPLGAQHGLSPCRRRPGGSTAAGGPPALRSTLLA